jgi:hypothetical protein
VKTCMPRASARRCSHWRQSSLSTPRDGHMRFLPAHRGVLGRHSHRRHARMVCSSPAQGFGAALREGQDTVVFGGSRALPAAAETFNAWHAALDHCLGMGFSRWNGARPAAHAQRLRVPAADILQAVGWARRNALPLRRCVGGVRPLLPVWPAVAERRRPRMGARVLGRQRREWPDSECMGWISSPSTRRG